MTMAGDVWVLPEIYGVRTVNYSGAALSACAPESLPASVCCEYCRVTQARHAGGHCASCGAPLPRLDVGARGA